MASLLVVGCTDQGTGRLQHIDMISVDDGGQDQQADGVIFEEEEIRGYASPVGLEILHNIARVPVFGC